MNTATNNSPQMSFIMQSLEILLCTLLLAFNSLVLDLPAQTVIIAITGSLSGAIVLTYFKRDKWQEMLFQTVCAALSGLVFGAFFQEYLALEKINYIGFNFFVCSLLSLIFLRALVSFSESNASEIIKNAIQRALNLQTKEEKVERYKRKIKNLSNED